MSSDLACIGLETESARAFDDLVRVVGPAAKSVGRAGRVEVRRWQDPGGARLVFRMRDGVAESFVPSFAGSPGVRLGDLHRLNDDVWSAAALDETGDQFTSLAFELEEVGLVDDDGHPAATATLVALGRAITIHADETAFNSSPASFLDQTKDAKSEPPAGYLDKGLKWPLSMAAQSFISSGVFASPAEADATALMNGTVLHAERRATAQTGQMFTVVRVRCLGMEVDLCLAARDHPAVPQPGQIVGGMVYLVASLGPDFLPSSSSRSILSRLRRKINRRD